MKQYDLNVVWVDRFMRLADQVSTWSKDPSTQVGAVITDRHNRVLGLGFNGFPRGVLDDPMLLGDRAEKHLRVLHAEENAVLNATGRDLKNAVIYCTHPPCAHCSAIIIQSGITSVVSYSPSADFVERYKDNMKVSDEMFEQAQVDYHVYRRL